MKIKISRINDHIGEAVLKGTFDHRDLVDTTIIYTPLRQLADQTKYILLLCRECNAIRTCGINFFIEIQERLEKKDGLLFFIESNINIKEAIHILLGKEFFGFYDSKNEALEVIRRREQGKVRQVQLYHLSGKLKRIVDVYSLDNRISYRIGRSSDSNIQLLSPAVSRDHAVIFADRGNWYLQPTSKTATDFLPYTSLNFSPIEVDTLIRDYDYIGIGEGESDILLFKNDSLPLEINFCQGDVNTVCGKLHPLDIADYYQSYYEIFKRLHFHNNLDFAKLQTTLQIYALLFPKAFQPATTDLTEIGELILCYIVQLVGNIDTIVLGTVNRNRKLRILGSRLQQKISINVPENLILEALDSSQGMIISESDYLGMVVPLIEEKERLGFLYIQQDDNNIEFGKKKLVSLMANMNSIAMAIRNSLIVRKMEAKSVLVQELKNARVKQDRLAPKNIKKIPYLELCCCLQQSLGIGGDYYDIIPAADKDSYYIMMGDAQGHGMSAALIVATVRAYVHLLLKMSVPINEVLCEVDQLLKADFGASTHMSALLLHWHSSNHILQWCRAGHYPPLFYNALTDKVVSLPRKRGSSLGMGISKNFEIDTMDLNPEDTLLLYTDGIIEAQNPEEEEFGINRLKEHFSYFMDKPLNEILHGILSEVFVFMHEKKNVKKDEATLLALQSLRRDDITLLALRAGTSKFCQGNLPMFLQMESGEGESYE